MLNYTYSIKNKLLDELKRIEIDELHILKQSEQSIYLINQSLIDLKEYIRHKTDIPVRVPLLPPAMAIIEKYKNNPRVLESGRLLPVYANQLLNNYLKEIADFCGIEKPLSFHIARHTFATTVTLTNGVPIETVSKLLGHTSIKTTQIYAKVIERKVSEDMKNLRAALSNKQNTDGSNLKVMNE